MRRSGRAARAAAAASCLAAVVCGGDDITGPRGGLLLFVSISDTRIELREAGTLTYTVRNVSRAPVTFGYPDCEPIPYIEDAIGRLVFPLNEEAFCFGRSSQTVTLAPGAEQIHTIGIRRGLPASLGIPVIVVEQAGRYFAYAKARLTLGDGSRVELQSGKVGFETAP